MSKKRYIDILGMKIVVFDLDETLGYFTQLNIFWNSLKKYYQDVNNIILNQNDFNVLIDLYPECLRPNIINILEFLKTKKETNCCKKMLIYTNNTGGKEWTKMICEYFDSKLTYTLFDQIIGAFKIDGKRYELGRTSHNKKYEDLIRCTRIPNNTEICYLDDTYYPHMDTEQIYYIHVEPYFHDLEFDEMITRYLSSKKGRIIMNKNEFILIMNEQIKSYRYAVVPKDPEEYDVEKVLGKQMLHLLEIFFDKTNKKSTRKNKNVFRNKTTKNIKAIQKS
jgi:hypothetical protein